VSLYRQGEAEALESLPIGQICSYGVSDSNTFRITAGDRDLLFETTKVSRLELLSQRLYYGLSNILQTMQLVENIYFLKWLELRC